MKKGMIKATGPFERVVHWCLALSCLFLCITGMGMMYHSLNFIGTIFGGMGNLKVIHNYTGIFFGVSLLFAIVMWWKEAGAVLFPRRWPVVRRCRRLSLACRQHAGGRQV